MPTTNMHTIPTHTDTRTSHAYNTHIHKYTCIHTNAHKTIGVVDNTTNSFNVVILIGVLMVVHPTRCTTIRTPIKLVLK